MKKKIIIGITKPEARFENYQAWIKGGSNDIELITLSPETDNASEVKKCDGVLLSGGIDVSPALYGSTQTDYPFAPKTGSDRVRDDFEIKVFDLAQQNQVPVLAICRGLQLVNVCLGGTLVPDLEEAGMNDHKRSGETDKLHPATTIPGTLLASITGAASGIVNSAHHQAIDKVSDRLSVNCTSAEGVIEGTEWKDPAGKPALLCVQWHPERMPGKKQDPFSENIRNWFLNEAKK